MMEFTMSRVCLCACGIILLAAVAAPASSVFDDRAERCLEETADRLAEALDTFWDSEADVMTLRMSAVLPDPSCSLCLDGHKVIVIRNGREYPALSETVSEPMELGYGDEAELVRSGDRIRLSGSCG